MSDEFIKVLDHLCDKLGVAIDWSSENVLPYAQQLMEKFVAYELWSSIAITTIWIILFAICMIITCRNYKYAVEDCWDESEPSYWFAVAGIIFSVACGIVLICVVCCQTFDIITCLTFPEKLIFNLVQNMK